MTNIKGLRQQEPCCTGMSWVTVPINYLTFSLTSIPVLNQLLPSLLWLSLPTPLRCSEGVRGDFRHWDRRRGWQVKLLSAWLLCTTLSIWQYDFLHHSISIQVKTACHFDTFQVSKITIKGMWSGRDTHHRQSHPQLVSIYYIFSAIRGHLGVSQTVTQL